MLAGLYSQARMGETMAPQHAWSPTVCLGYPAYCRSTDAQEMSLSHTTEEDTDTLLRA